MSRIPSFTDSQLDVNVGDIISPEEFEELCRENRDLPLELTSTGELVVMPPTGTRTGIRNANLTSQLVVWAEKDESGVAFDSSTMFALPNKARRSPDAAWIKRERWNALTEDEQEGFGPLCPDFVVEIRSRSDNLPRLEKKMLEYIANGALQAWLIDPRKRRVHIYAPDDEVTVLENPEMVSGGSLLPGFELQMSRWW